MTKWSLRSSLCKYFWGDLFTASRISITIINANYVKILHLFQIYLFEVCTRFTKSKNLLITPFAAPHLPITERVRHTYPITMASHRYKLSVTLATLPSSLVGTKLRYRFCKVQTAASAVGCGWMWSEKLNKRKSDGGMTGDVCYRIWNIDRSL